jgi:hypothetical protein
VCGGEGCACSGAGSREGRGGGVGEGEPGSGEGRVFEESVGEEVCEWVGIESGRGVVNVMP